MFNYHTTGTCNSTPQSLPAPYFGEHSFSFDPSLPSPTSGTAPPTKPTSATTPSSAASATDGASRPGRKRNWSPETEEQADRRRRNNVAAAKYRQKKVDRITELEALLEGAESERDELKMALAKRDAEVELLRKLLATKEGRA